MVAAAIRTIFAQPDQDHVHQQLDVVADTLSFTVPEVANLLIEAKADLLAFSAFPMVHWRHYVETAIMLTGRPKPVVLARIG